MLPSALPQGVTDLETALNDLTDDLKENDIIKSQTGFSAYVSRNVRGDLGWIGNLTEMKPGEGYRLLMQAPDDTSFIYPYIEPPPVSGLLALGKDGADSLSIHEKAAAGDTIGWQVDPHAYKHNMTIIGEVDVEGRLIHGEKDVLAAFVNGECRGVVNPLQLNKSLYFLMIYSNKSADEKITFRYYDSSTDLVYDITEQIAFEVDAANGTVVDPVAFSADATLGSENLGELPVNFSLAQNFPNPFNPRTTIKFALPRAASAKLEIFNINGRLVRTVVDKDVPAGYYRVQWDGCNEQGIRVASGVLFYCLRADEFVAQRKMILIK